MSFGIETNLDCNYTFQITLAPSSVPFGVSQLRENAYLIHPKPNVKTFSVIINIKNVKILIHLDIV